MALSRRSFLKRAAGAAGALAVAPLATQAAPVPVVDAPHIEEARILRQAAVEEPAMLRASISQALSPRDVALARIPEVELLLKHRLISFDTAMEMLGIPKHVDDWQL